MNDHEIIERVRTSACFESETAYVRRGGIAVSSEPRLFKHLENDLVRVVFPTQVSELDEGTVIAIVTLYDLRQEVTVYAHTICAGPEVNVLLKAVHSPLLQAKPQPGEAGDSAVAKFIAWKRAAWIKFLNEELEHGTEAASRVWIENFWRALDRMFGGDVLRY